MPAPPPRPRPESLHPRNRHRGGLDFPRLIARRPGLLRFVSINQWGNQSLDFADPEAQRALSAALLAEFYGVARWELPHGWLCPSIPGRADTIHTLADLLASCNGGAIPRGERVCALDVGVGANCIYPLIGNAEYGWRFVGTDVDPAALAVAARIVEGEPRLRGAIELRLQAAPERILEGVLRLAERFDLTLCNPPFHASAREAEEGSRRKWKNLGRAGAPGQRPALNFGGRSAELWCPGGERAFVRRLIAESAQARDRCFWFTSLVSKSKNLPAIQAALKQAGVVESRTIEMTQGQKTSRLVAWTFLEPRQREEWRARRWQARAL